MRIESKVRIYKTCVRSVLPYAAETSAETLHTKRIRNRMMIEDSLRDMAVQDVVSEQEHDGTCGKTMWKELTHEE